MSLGPPPDVRTVGDTRTGYAQRGFKPQEFPRWDKKTYRQAGTFKVSGPGTLGGVIVRRVGADVTVTVYDYGGTILDTLPDAAIAAPIGVTGAAGAIDGFVNMPIKMDAGIMVVISVAADVTLYFV